MQTRLFPSFVTPSCLRAFVVLLPLLTSVAAANPEIPGPPQEKPIAITGATIHPVSGPAIEGGTIVFDKGKITAVGKDVMPPADAEVIRLEGKHVYPGLFDAGTNLGLVEINSVRATIDVEETGQLNPNVRAIVAVNPDSELIPVTRANGVLLAHTVPQGGLISGKSGIIQLDGWTWEDLALSRETGMYVEWPRVLRRTSRLEDQPDQPNIDENMKRLRTAFEDARAYAAARKADENYPIDARWEAMQSVLEGKLPLIARADDAASIQSAVAFATEHKLKLIIHGGYDAPLAAQHLKPHDIPVIIAGVYRLPQRRGDDYDAPYTLANRLREAGIRFCISSAGRFGASNVRNLPYHAATTAAYGLPPDEALKSITLYPAQILGVADRVGSLEAGKDATLFVSSGDILETATQVEAAYIQGRKVELDDRHKRLYRKYSEKYERQK
jgi:imidazolonepropionase-like amidohydrolase